MKFIISFCDYPLSHVIAFLARRLPILYFARLCAIHCAIFLKRIAALVTAFMRSHARFLSSSWCIFALQLCAEHRGLEVFQEFCTCFVKSERYTITPVFVSYLHGLKNRNRAKMLRPPPPPPPPPPASKCPVTPPPAAVQEGRARGHRHNSSQNRRELFFAHCEQAVENERLKTTNAELRLEQCKASYKDLQMQIEQIQEAAEKTEQSRTHELLQAQEAKDKAVHRCSEISKKLKECQDQLFDAQEKNTRLNNQYICKRLKECQDQLYGAKAENTRLNNQHKRVELEKKRLEVKVEQSGREMAKTIRDHHENMQHQMAKEAELLRKVADLTKKNEVSVAKAEAAMKATKDLSAKLQAEAKVNEVLSHQLNAATKENKDLSRKLHDAEEANEDLSAKMESWIFAEDRMVDVPGIFLPTLHIWWPYNEAISLKKSTS